MVLLLSPYVTNIYNAGVIVSLFVVHLSSSVETYQGGEYDCRIQSVLR